MKLREVAVITAVKYSWHKEEQYAVRYRQRSHWWPFWTCWVDVRVRGSSSGTLEQAQYTAELALDNGVICNYFYSGRDVDCIEEILQS